MIMLSALRSDKVEGTDWLQPFLQDFRTRFLTLLAGAYKVSASTCPFLPFSVMLNDEIQHSLCST